MPAVADAAIDVALAVLVERAERDVPLGPYTTYRVGGPAAIFVRARTIGDLLAVGVAARKSGLDVLVVGRGSNLLVADEGFGGIVVSTLDLADELHLDLDAAVVTASAGLALPVVARRCAAAGLTGFEWAVGVPGSIGGAVRMNAGGHGSDVAATLIEVSLVDLREVDAERAVRRVAAGGLHLGFRSSGLAEHEVVVDARLQLAHGDRDVAERTIGEIVAWRREHQPGGQNAGSVFVNPVPGEVSSGELIDAAGLRGYRLGSATVSDKHANFIQADPGGTAADVFAVMQVVRDRVEAASGFRLRSEIRLVGFGDGASS
jgi:UDP-N-acetylmuramate dehydrogenase